jgi:hypothetical protein
MVGTLYILRSRWQEVLLIVGLQGAGQFALMQVVQDANSTEAGKAELLPFAALLTVTFWVVAKMLSIGFARTSFTDGPMHYDPWMLLKIGYHYFWRIIGIELFIGMLTVSLIVGFYIIAVMAGAQPEKMTKEQVSNIMPYCLAGGLLLVAKPMLFGPASIMVTDCGVFGAFAWLSWLKLWTAKKLMVAYILWLAVFVTPGAIAQFYGQAFIENYAIMAAFAVMAGLLVLLIYVAAVRAIGEVYLKAHHTEDGFGEEPQTDTGENQKGPQ